MQVRLEHEGNIAVIVIDNPPVNAGSAAVRRGLLDAVQRVTADDDCAAAILIGAGKTFIAGSDLKEFGKPLAEPQLPAIIAAIEASPKPFVAAIHGAALGGGFELALGCDARIAIPGAVVGLPEVTLGMIPGAGGTQRLPRLAGIAAAIEIICSGRRIEATEAQAAGLIDAIVTDTLRKGAIDYARRLVGRKRRLGDLPVPADTPEQIEAAAAAAMRAGRHRPQVAAAIESIKNALRLPFKEALLQERAVFQELRMSEEAAALRYLFFAEREAAVVPGLAPASPRPVSHVGIVGAGTMGVGIAACFADAGFSVTLVDRDHESVQQGFLRLRGLYEQSVASGRIGSAEAEARLARVTPSSELDGLAHAGLIVEAVFEDMDAKSDVFRRLDKLASSDTILASNTSYLNLDTLAAMTERPGQVVGLHFFSPAQVMRLVEVVQGAQTAPEALATALHIARQLRKLPIVARVGEGFIGNRIYAAYRRQCEFMLEEGAYPEQIDAALQAFGFAMGPFAVADLSGLDIAWRMRQRLAATRDPRERYVTIADTLCARGRLGRKTGSGWYQYAPGARQGLPDPEVHALIDAAAAARGLPRRCFSDQEICWRALMAMVNEAALLLEEGIALRPSDVDLVLVHGYGFPKYRGGPLFWAGGQDRRQLQAQLAGLAKATGYGFRRGQVEELLDRMP